MKVWVPTCGVEYADTERFCPRDGTPLRSRETSESLVGSVIADRYHVLSKLGEGGMGQVYLAEHLRMKRKSAVKVTHPAMTSDATTRSDGFTARPRTRARLTIPTSRRCTILARRMATALCISRWSTSKGRLSRD